MSNEDKANLMNLVDELLYEKNWGGGGGGVRVLLSDQLPIYLHSNGLVSLNL